MKGGKGTEKLLIEIKKEAAIAKRLQHENIVKLLAAEQDPLNDQPILIFERLGPSIYDALDREMAPPSSALRMQWLIGIAAALKFLHEQDPPIVHRDLKPDNVLIHYSDQRAVLADFGRSTTLSMRSYTQRDVPKHGHVLYAPPESFPRGYKPSTSYDVYSFGMTMYCILTRHWPFEGEAMLDMDIMVKQWIASGDRPYRNGTIGFKPEADPISDASWTLIQRCWSQTIEERPNFVEIHANILRQRIFEFPYNSFIEKVDILSAQISVEIDRNQLIAYGSLSTFYVGTFQDEQVAVKIFEKFRGRAGKIQLNKMLHDIAIGKSLSHQNIVKYLGIVMDPLTGDPALVTERLGESLYEVIPPNAPSLKSRTNWLLDIAEAFVYLHSQNPPVIHRNLTPSKVCLHPHDKRAMLTSFGISYSLAVVGSDTKDQRQIGSILFAPPEAYERGYSATTKYDVFSFGMTMYFILTRHMPFEREECFNQPMITSCWIYSGHRPSRMGTPGYSKAADSMSNEAWNLIQRCWNQNESERPSFAEIYEEIVSWD